MNYAQSTSSAQEQEELRFQHEVRQLTLSDSFSSERMFTLMQKHKERLRSITDAHAQETYTFELQKVRVSSLSITLPPL